jgi:hypothetical protein
MCQSLESLSIANKQPRGLHYQFSLKEAFPDCIFLPGIGTEPQMDSQTEVKVDLVAIPELKQVRFQESHISGGVIQAILLYKGAWFFYIYS